MVFSMDHCASTTASVALRFFHLSIHHLTHILIIMHSCVADFGAAKRLQTVGNVSMPKLLCTRTCQDAETKP